ncbi:MAG: DMT family transporter [Huintestinicola sp.]
MKNTMKGNIMLLICALIWGSAFVAQSEGMNYVEPFTYMAARYVLGGAVLIPFILISGRKNGEKVTYDRKMSFVGGLICGVILFAASAFQQFGIKYTSAGKAGFITALYIIIVPMIGFFLGRKTSPKVWICAAAALAGFYLLCVKEGFTVSAGDMLVLICAVLFSFHIMAVDGFNEKNADPVLMSCVQFFAVSALSAVGMLITEQPSWDSIISAAVPILYAGVLSSGVAYTLQAVGQKYTTPSAAAMLMSLESVFAAVFGCLLLHETLSGKELLGCAAVFAAVIAAQLPMEKRTKGHNANS